MRSDDSNSGAESPVLDVSQRSKLESCTSHLFMVAQMIYRDPEECTCVEQFGIFVSGNVLISIQEDSGMDVFDPVRRRIGVMMLISALQLVYFRRRNWL